MPLKLELKVDRDKEEAIYFQIYEQIRDLILNGSISKDSKLPSIRALSKELNVNALTVVNAYKMLEKDKLVYKKEGSGTFVIPIEGDFLLDDSPLYFEPGEIDLHKDYGGNIIDFTSSAPDPDLFPIKDFKEIMDKVLEEDGARAFMYQTSIGYPALRNSLQHYSEGYGIESDAEDIYVVSGAQQGIDIIAKALVKSGDYVFVESPTYSGAVAAFKLRGARLVEVPLLRDGPGIKELERLVKLFKPVLFYTMPCFHNPTGCTYSVRKKKYLLLLARKNNFRVLEDDYAGDLDYTDSRTLPLKAYDDYNRVIYLKSFSKIFMPGLRLAYLVLPQDIKGKAADAKIASDISTSGLMQRVLCRYIEEGILEKHTEYLRKELAIRYLEMIRAVKRCIKEAVLYEPKGGLNLWIKLPKGISSAVLYDRCLKRDIVISPGTFYYNDERGLKYIRLSFAGVDIDRIWEGVSVIGAEVEYMKDKQKKS